jgi:serine phosphatase RsbU (regulator of sigma subunit)
MNTLSATEQLKNQIVENQKIIDQLNSELARKTQEVQIFQEISTEINNSLDLDSILMKMLLLLDKTFEFRHSMVLLVDEESGDKLSVAASHGYKNSGLGAEVKFGEGIIGVVAKRKKLMRMGNIGSQRAYLNSVKNQMNISGQKTEAEIKLPGLNNVESQVAIPLLLENNLVGVLAVESDKANVFDSRDELIVTILANQAASAIQKARAHQKLLSINENLEHLVSERTKEVVYQKELVEEKNHELLSSITYAKRIQDALLPSKAYLEEHMESYFVLYKPKDIVSGDFYWANKKENKLFFAAVDCTGHGVPGAFVSIMAHSGLQRSLVLFGLRTPAAILDKLNESVIDMFSRNNTSTDIKDGMDIAVCALDRDTMKLEFAGANNPMYLLRNGEMIEVKGDKQPIGQYVTRKNFTNHTMDVKKGDIIYLFTDGFADQFGGHDAKKFKYKSFKDLLLANHHLPMREQGGVLDDVFKTWKGSLDQVDDVTVLGIKV